MRNLGRTSRKPLLKKHKITIEKLNRFIGYSVQKKRGCPRRAASFCFLRGFENFRESLNDK